MAALELKMLSRTPFRYRCQQLVCFSAFRASLAAVSSSRLTATVRSPDGLALSTISMSYPKVKDWRIHDLRRTVATGLQKLGVNLQTIEAVLGHTSGSRSGVVGVYQRHSFDAEKRAALDAWGAHVASLV